MHFVHRRYGCNKFWRQTFVEKSRRLVGFLDRSASDEPRRGETPWGGVESMGRSNGYQIPLGEGLLSTTLGATERLEFHRHQSILRSLAYKWQRILFSCWKNREKYDEPERSGDRVSAGEPVGPGEAAVKGATSKPWKNQTAHSSKPSKQSRKPTPNSVNSFPKNHLSVGLSGLFGIGLISRQP
ncbi:hypothetical protein [Roseibacillus ishigakijimensis]|uniref:hypothetical protein n=1 Tax=Roseibacillus ishigakijimensis TaxID=454146 RepID=UPI00363E2D96